MHVSTEGHDEDAEEILKVPPRQGEQIMSTIRNAMEENQMQAMVEMSAGRM